MKIIKKIKRQRTKATQGAVKYFEALTNIKVLEATDQKTPSYKFVRFLIPLATRFTILELAQKFRGSQWEYLGEDKAHIDITWKSLIEQSA